MCIKMRQRKKLWPSCASRASVKRDYTTGPSSESSNSESSSKFKSKGSPLTGGTSSPDDEGGLDCRFDSLSGFAHAIKNPISRRRQITWKNLNPVTFMTPAFLGHLMLEQRWCRFKTGLIRNEKSDPHKS